MPYSNDLCRELSRCTVGDTCRVLPPSQVLYRGGQSDQPKPFGMRTEMIFLSSSPSYAEDYVSYRRDCRYGYLYRTTNQRQLRFVSMTSMSDVVRVALLAARNSFEPTAWQRENLIPLARQALGIEIDAIYIASEDQGPDELLVDNSLAIMRLDCLYTFPKNRVETNKKEMVFGKYRGHLTS